MTTVSSDPWKLIDREIELKINIIYEIVLNWKSRFIV